MQFQTTHTLAELAAYLQGTCLSGAQMVIQGVNTLKEASSTDITFLAQPQYVPLLAETHAAAVVVGANHADKCNQPIIIVPDPYIAFGQLMRLCAPDEPVLAGIHPSAVVAKTAVIAKTATIEAQAFIGEHVQIGEGVHIGPQVSIGAHSTIGAQTKLFAQVGIYHQVHIGERCIIHSGAVIGADGFGFANHKGNWIKIPQLAGVEIADDVEIGANTAIDRGVLTPTRIGRGVKIDNLVQIGHNVQVGDHTIITGCVAIAGSTTIGKHCAIGGGSCINGHIQITDGVQITAMSGVLASIDKPGVYSSGSPAIENAKWRKLMASYFRLPDILKRLRALEQDK